jgi:hypothetical protein
MRFELPSMYSRIVVRLLDSERFEHEGHAFDISEGGIQFELDRAIEPGTPIAMRIDLPRAAVERSSERRSIFVFANVVWLEDEDEPGPVRMAAVFTRFARAGDQELLRRRITSGRYALAA